MELIGRNHGGRKIKRTDCVANQMIIMVHIFILSSNIRLKFKDQIKTSESGHLRDWFWPEDLTLAMNLFFL